MPVIKATHLNFREFFLNTDHILFVESTPDTLLVLDNGDRILVRESPDEIVDLIVEAKRRVLSGVSQTRLHIIRREEPPQDASAGDTEER